MGRISGMLDGIRSGLGRMIAPGMMDQGQVKALVAEEVKAARMAMPINVDYDPRGEGYRRLTTDQNAENRRDLMPVAQEFMLELAYYLYDTSGLVKRFVRDTRNFALGDGVSWTVEEDPDGSADQVLWDFWDDSMNQMSLRLPKRVEFLGLLGEQCWPVAVNPRNGRVWCSYIDPVNIDDVMTVAGFPEIPAAVKMVGASGRSGKIMPAVREEIDPMRREYGRLVGECFYFAVNNPPNGPRGRSDLIHLFDFVSAFEEGIFDELDRLKLIKAFIWDVQLKGATDDDIKKFLATNKAPKAGAVRAHNENVTWEAVAPDLKMSDNKALFDLVKTYLAACMNRPDSWLGSGGKAYQTEADLMGEPTFQDLGDRQRFIKYSLEYLLRFVLDQATIYGAIKAPAKNGRWYVTVNMPEMSKKDLKKIVDGLFTLAQALLIAESQGWLTKATAAELFANVAGQSGIEIDASEEIKNAAKDPNVTKDYAAREALIAEIAARVENAKGPSATRRSQGGAPE